MSHLLQTIINGKSKYLLISVLLLISSVYVFNRAKAQQGGTTCFGQTATILGTNQADVIQGTEGNDVIVSIGGNDTINALGGDDIICSGQGEDEIHGGSGHDTIDGGKRNDNIFGESGDDIIFGSEGKDTLHGGTGFDELDGGTGGDDVCINGEINNNCEDIQIDNTPPVANAGPDQSVFVGDTVQLDGSGSSDVDGDPLTFLWSFQSKPVSSNATLSDPTALQPTFDVDVFGTYILDLTVNDGTDDSTPDSVTITTLNSPPLANAGPDQSVFVGDTVQLDGSGSTDVDGDTLSFSWSFVSTPQGSNATISDPTAVQPTFDVDVFGTYILELIVNDGSVDSEPDTVTITTLNSPPVAHAGPDQAISVPTTVQLNASGSTDVDGDLLTFNWSLTSVPVGSSAQLSDPNIVNPTFDADLPGTYVAQLIVNDGTVNSAPDTVTINTENIRPVADAGLDQTVFVTDTVQLDGSGSSDADDDPLTFSWSFVSVPIGSTTTIQNPISVNPTFFVDAFGNYVVQLIVNDGAADSDPDTVLISTDNSRPVADAGPDQTVPSGALVQLDGTGSFDVDNDPLTFDWNFISVPPNSSVLLSDPSSSQPTFQVDRPGTYISQLIVNDGTLDSPPDTVAITRENASPILDPIGNQTISLGNTLTLNLIGTDADGDILEFFVIPIPLPSGASMNTTTGTFIFTPTASEVGDNVFTFSMSDGALSDSETITITVTGVTTGGDTTLTGRVLDANDASQGTETPIVGATVSIIDSGVSTVTDSSGNFTLDNIPGGNQILDIDSSTANPAPDGSQYAGFRESILLILGAVNNLASPLYLPRIDSSSLTTVDPANTTEVNNPNLGVSITVPPNTAQNPDGTDFTGELSISLVPEGFAPAPLPEELEPGLLVTIQPVGVTFANPVPITFPNVDNLPPGSEVDIWSLDPNTGDFIVVGVGQVSADGSVIETISGGIIAADWHAPLPPPPLSGPPLPEPPCQSCCTVPTGSTTALATGNLVEDHSTVSYRSLNQSRSLRFVYNSQLADPRPIITSDSIILQRAAVPITASISLSVAGVDQGTETFTDTSGFSETMDEDFRQAIQFDASSLPTGVYPFDVKVKSNYLQSSVASIRSGSVQVNNQNGSPFGAGWTLDGLSRLHLQEDGSVLLIEGDGASWHFTPLKTALDLQNWTQEGVPTGQIWTVSADGTTVTQTENAAPNFFVSPDTFIDTTIQGTFSVSTSNDDDIIGFVFGYNSPIAANGDADNDYEFLLFDWKQTEQGGTHGFIAQEGYSLSNVNGIIESFPPNFWGHEESPEFDVLATDYGSGKGWNDFTEHEFELIYEQNRIRVSIDGNLIFDVPGSFPEGRFGFYNYSQEFANYQLFAMGPSSPFFASPLGDYSTLVKNIDGTFTRTMKDGTEINFDSQGLQNSIVDRNGNTTTFSYDANGLLTSITDPVGMVSTLAYTGGKLSSVTDPANRTTTFQHDGTGNLTKITDPDNTFRMFSYDPNHHMITQTSKRGFVTTYQYNSAGRNVSALRPDGSLWSVSPSSLVGLPDIAGGIGTESNPAPVVKPDDVVATFTDGNGNTSTYKTNEFGAATEFTDALNRITTTVRDENNNVIQSIDPRGNVTDLTYDGIGNLLTTTNQSIGATTTFTYTNEGFNQIKTITDPNNNSTNFNYDASGNLTSISDALTNQTMMTYDSRGLLLSSTDALNSTVTVDYDPVTRNLIGTTDQLLNPTDFTLDAAGNVITTTDGEGKATNFVYDSMNRLTQVFDPDLANTDYSYDSAGNLGTVTDARGKTTSFAYDSLNRLNSRTDPLGNSETFTYDGNGNLISTIDRNNQAITFEYDAGNQHIKKTLPGNLITSFAYDNSGNLITANDPDSNLAMTYDGGNRLQGVSTAGSPNQPNVTISYSYDSNGNRLSMTDSITGTTSYTYDALNRSTGITNPQGQTLNFAYDAVNRRTQTTFPNGVTTNLSYDAKSQLTSLVNQDGATNISTFDYTYDGVGNRISMDSTRAGVSVNAPLSYTYDNLYRLTQGTSPLPSSTDETFTYDPVGNRLTKAGQGTPSVFDDANRLIEDQEFIYNYDNNGNLVHKTDKATSEVTIYTYDAENQLIQINKPGMTATYRYDGIGRRIEKNVDGVITRYVYDGRAILLEYDGSNVLTARYTNGLRIDEPLIMERGGVSSFYNADGLGSITELTDSTGTVSHSFVYDSFGSIVDESGSIRNPFTYTGREFDIESGLYYYRARYYDPRIGRFIHEDPLGLGGGDINFYVYVNNNPVNFVDPLGLRSCKLDAVGNLIKCVFVPLPAAVPPLAACGLLGPAVKGCLAAVGIIETKNLVVTGILCYSTFKKDFDECDNNDDNNCLKSTTGPPGPAPPDCGTCGSDIRR